MRETLFQRVAGAMILGVWHGLCFVAGVPRDALSSYDYVNRRYWR